MKNIFSSTLLCFAFVACHAQSWDKVGTLSLNSTVEVVYNDTVTNSLYLGGNFNVSGYTRIAKWDGTSYTTLGTGMDASVKSILRYNGDLYAGGNFTVAGSVITNRIAKWNGTAWSMVGTGITSSVVNAMCEFNGELIVGGYFTTAGGVSANYIAKWNGTSWSALGAGMDNEVQALCVYNGELYAAGEFLNAGGVSANYIAKWNGSSWSAVGTGTNLYIDALYVWNNLLYVGGRFTSAGGSTAYYLAKWNGSAWSSAGFGINDDFVYTIASYNNELYVGGEVFADASVNFGDHIAKWNGTSWSNVSVGLSSAVYGLTTYKGLLYAGGDFSTVFGANRLAKWDNIAPVTNRFQKIYKGANTGPNWDETVNDVEQTLDWGYLIAGHTTSFGQGAGDAFLIQTDTAGSIAWAKVYGSAGNWETVRAAVASSDGSIITTGLRQVSSKNDVFVMSLDKDGTTNWVKSYGLSADNEQGWDIKKLSAVSYVMTGMTGTDPLMIKINGAGNIVWSKKYVTTPPEEINSMEVTSSGGFILAGTTGASPNYNMYLMNMDSNGNVLWDRSFGGTGEEKGLIAKQTNDGGFIIGGKTSTYGAGYYDAYLVKLNAAGTVQWSKTYGTTDFEEIDGLEQTADGGYLLTASMFYIAAGSTKYDFLTIKVTSDGSLVNAKTYGGPEWETAMGMDKCSDGGLVMVGLTNSFPYSGGADYNIYMVKTDSLLNSGSCHQINQPLLVGSPTTSVSIPGAVASAAGLLESTPSITEATAPFTPFELGLTVSISKTNVSCNGGANGQAIANVSGGIKPFTYLWSNGGSTTAISNLTATNYTFTVTDSTLCTITQTVSITQPTAYVVSSSVTNVSCFNGNNGAVNLSVSGNTPPYTYLWSPGGATTQDISNLTTNNYSVAIADANGCAASASASVVNSIAPIPICMVTVDSVASVFNTIMWVKPVTGGIDSFFIYRNISAVMTKIGGNKYSDVSLFTDITPGVDPQTKAHEYALSVQDTCGNESALSPTHITIHQLAPNYTSPPHRFDLSWSGYQGFFFADYEIWRDTSTGWHLLDLVPFTLSTTYSDIGAPHDSCRYRIQVTPAVPCTSTVKNPMEPQATTVKSGKSNSSDKTIGPTSINENAADGSISISPNPSSGTFEITSRKELIISLQIYNILGENVYSKVVNGKKTDVTIPDIAKGIYQLQVLTNAGVVNRKIVISR